MIVAMIPKDLLGDHLRELREAKKLSRPDLAKLVGAHPNQIQKLENGERTLSLDWMERLAPHLGVTPVEFLQGAKAPAIAREEPKRYQAEPNLQSDKIPVLGTAEGGAEGWSLWNGDVVDHVARPPFLAGVPNAYACYVTGTSMEPRYHPGELIFVHPGKPVTIGAYVLVQARPRQEGEPPRAVVKRLAKRSPTKIVLEQFNPAKTFDVQLNDVISVHRIMGSGE